LRSAGQSAAKPLQLLSQTADSRKLVVVEPSADPRDDDELLVATARGDADAFGVFYRRHVAEVLAFLARRTGSYGWRLI
jgi:hypothetical protein